jgi:hypothetical protein
MPVAGRACHVWARVTNSGAAEVSNAAVRFYHASPSVGFDRSTAHLIGSSFVTLGAGESADVLCNRPWRPGPEGADHACIVAEAFHPSLDPLPAVNAFGGPLDRHVAQRNLVVAPAVKGLFRLAFEICNPGCTPRKSRIRVREGRLSQLEPLLGRLGPGLCPAYGQGLIHRLGVVPLPCPEADALEEASPVLEGIELEPRHRVEIALVGAVEGGASLLHVEELGHDGSQGGFSVLVLPERQLAGSRGRYHALKLSSGRLKMSSGFRQLRWQLSGLGAAAGP